MFSKLIKAFGNSYLHFILGGLAFLLIEIMTTWVTSLIMTTFVMMVWEYGSIRHNWQAYKKSIIHQIIDIEMGLLGIEFVTIVPIILNAVRWTS